MSPALVGSALLHAAVALSFLISWPWARELKVGAVVPVKIVTTAPTTDLRPAVEAPTEQTPLTELPDPSADLQAVEPAPTPEPAPPAPAPKPAPPKAAPPTPAPKPPTAKPTEKTPPPKTKAAPKAAENPSLDLDALLATVKGSRPAGAKSSSAPKGPPRPSTSTVARPAAGSAEAANALAGLAEELQRRWNPNCEVEGGRTVVIRATFTLGSSGQVVGDVATEVRAGPQTAVSQVAAERARSAVKAAAPFRNLPSNFYGDRIAVNFNAREACA